MIQVTLIIGGPDIAPRRVEQSVRGLDVAPTVLALFKLPALRSAMGSSLSPDLGGKTTTETPLVAVDGIRPVLVDGRYKTILNVELGMEELYDLQVDPRERRDLAEEPFGAMCLRQSHEFFECLNPPRRG
jgi:arylsulfatase A-like enzyme